MGLLLQRLMNWMDRLHVELRSTLIRFSVVIGLRRNSAIRPRRRDQTDRLVYVRMKKPFRGELGVRPSGTDFFTWYEIFVQDIYALILRELSECRTIIDLGANIGLATLYLAHAYPDARIVSVEPEESNHAILQTNLTSLIAEQRCQVVRAAVWSRDSMLSLDWHMKGGHDSYQFAESGKGQSVEALSMATLFERSGFGEVDLLKVDIEGAEVQLFEGDLSWLDRVNAIAIEFHGNSRARSRFDTILRSWRVIEDRQLVLAIRPRRESDSLTVSAKPLAAEAGAREWIQRAQRS